MNVALINPAGAVQWFFGITACDDSSNLTTLRASLSVNAVAHTAAYTMSSGLGSCVQLTSTVSAHPTKGTLGAGYDVNGVLHPEYTTTFKVNVLTSQSLAVTFAGELAEQDGVNSGGVAELNAAIRAILGSGGVAFDLVQVGLDANVTVTTTTQNVMVLMRGMTANRNVNLPAGVDGQRVTIKARADGSLVTHNIVVNSTGGATIENAASPLTMTNGTFGDGGSLSLEYSADRNEWERI